MQKKDGIKEEQVVKLLLYYLKVVHIGKKVLKPYKFSLSYLDAPMERIAGLDIPMPYAQDLEVKYKITIKL